MSGELDGYWPSPWPAEDGGPTRRQTPAAGFWLAGDQFTTTSRQCFGANMIVLRDPDQVFLQGNTLGVPDTTSWVERIDPITLEPLHRSPDLPGGPFWAGGIAVHRNGDLYVTYGRWCHRLDPVTLEPKVSVELPRPRPYNSLLVLPDGALSMKDFGGGRGAHALAPGEPGSQLVVLDPDTLAIVAEQTLAEGSIARLSAFPDVDGAGATVVVVGDQHLHPLRWDGSRLSPDGPPRRYLRETGQTFGWDAVIVDGVAWFLDDGEGTETFGPSLAGKGVSDAPLHLVRVDLDDPDDEPMLIEICGRPGGIVANPPAVDPTRRIVVGYDSGNGAMAAFTYDADDPTGQAPVLRWEREQHHGGHMLLDAEHGLLLTYDFNHAEGRERLLVVDLESGHVTAAIPTANTVQTVLFPAPGWHDDFYTVSFTTVTRVHRG